MSEYTFQDVISMLRNPNALGEGKQLKIKDLITSQNMRQILPEAFETIMREAIEPILVGSKLLYPLSYNGTATNYEMPAFGAISAGPISETGEYPEVNFATGGNALTAVMRKYGAAFRVNEETLEDSRWDIIGWFVRESAKALARLKEGNVWNMLNAVGMVTHDNYNPAGSLYGTTSGRDIAGTKNASVIMDDVFFAMSRVIENGFNPDTIIIHPRAWILWVIDPVMRAFALQNGGGSFFQQWQGTAANKIFPGINGAVGTAGQLAVPAGNTAGLAPTAPGAFNPQDSAAPMLPSYFGFPFRIIVSPYVPFDHLKNRTNIMVCDSSQLGALVTAYGPRMDEWDDKAHDLKKMKVKERYGLVHFHNGEQIALIKNVKCVPNEIVLPGQVSISGLTALDHSTAV